MLKRLFSSSSRFIIAQRFVLGNCRMMRTESFTQDTILSSHWSDRRPAERKHFACKFHSSWSHGKIRIDRVNVITKCIKCGIFSIRSLHIRGNAIFKQQTKRMLDILCLKLLFFLFSFYFTATRRCGFDETVEFIRAFFYLLFFLLFGQSENLITIWYFFCLVWPKTLWSNYPQNLPALWIH